MLIKNLYILKFHVHVNSLKKRCTQCGKDIISRYWTFKTTAFCSYRCYAVNSAGLLLILSSVFAFIFVASMVGMSFSPNLKPALYIPFLVALSFGPVPGYITSFLGYIYRKQDKKNPPPKYEETETESSVVEIATCVICKKPITSEEKYSEFEPCGHYIHHKHVAGWISDNKHCPKCGESIEKITFS